MNKKFSTLMAGLLLASSLPVVAQNEHLGNGEIPYRSQFVKSANLDAGEAFYGVKQIDGTKWYQLVVNGEGNPNGLTYVLTQERDYSTGRLYLAAKPIQDAVLTHSLWKIERSAQGVNASTWTFTNRETGYTITFDHTEAQKLTAEQLRNMDGTTTSKDAHFKGIRYLPETSEASVLRGCMTNWSWYSYNEQTSDIHRSKLLWSSFHTVKQDSIMALALVKMPNEKKVRYDAEHYYVKTVKGSSKDFQDVFNYDKSERVKGLVHIQPVVAGAKVLDDIEINSMIDSKGGLSFTKATDKRYPGYTRENEKGEDVKFTLITPDGNAVHNNPFDNTFIAEKSHFGVLDRTNYKPNNKKIADAPTAANLAVNANTYAGYNILFKKKGTEDEYLKVSEKTYENAWQDGNYNALKVAPEKYVRNSVMTPEEARYHWKVTYYATNDSVVLEPLNAHRFTYEGYNFVETPAQFYNTVNEGVAFKKNVAGENNSFNKAAGVPVALSLRNIGEAAADVKYYLTVATPLNFDTHQANQTYAAAPKFNARSIEYTQGTWMIAGDNPAYVTNGYSYKVIYNELRALASNENEITFKSINIDSEVVKDYFANMILRLAFNAEYPALVRTSFEDGLYFIQLKTDKPYVGNGARRNDAYLVYNHLGRMMYATENENQDFGIMPATQWVIKQKPCEVRKDQDLNYNKTPEVQVFNREYSVEGAPVFEGQLYITADSNVYIINHRDYFNPAESKGWFTKNAWTCSDTLKISLVDKTKYAEAWGSKFHGYKDLGFTGKVEDLVHSANHPYYLKYNDQVSDDETTNTAKYLFENKTGYLAMTNPDNPAFSAQQSLFEIEKIKVTNFGYNNMGTLPELERTVYALKVRDNNVIDNNYKYVVVVKDDKNRQRYAVRRLQDVNGQSVKIAEFYLKANELTYGETDTCYVLVDARSFDNVSGAKKANAIDLGVEILNTKNDIDAEITNLVDANNAKLYNRTFDANGWQVLEMVNDPDKLYANTLDEDPSYDFTAFQLVTDLRPLYKAVSIDRDLNGHIELHVNDGSVKQNLFEMATNQYTDVVALDRNFKYLGLTSEGIKPKKGEYASFYVDSIVTSITAPVSMPQYMLWVKSDSIADGYWCEKNTHGYFPDMETAEKADETHVYYYNGYVKGRALVNLNDTISKWDKMNMMDEAGKYRFNNYGRLGFVEAVHMVVREYEAGIDGAVEAEAGEYVYILRGTTLAKISDSKGYIIPDSLKKGVADKRIDRKVLNGTHRNYLWSFRYTEDEITDPSNGQGTGREHGDFLLETADGFENAEGTANSGVASIGGYHGGWIKMIHGVPVLSRNTTPNNQHNVLSGEAINETLYQAQIFNLKATDNGWATSNDEVTVGTVKVVGKAGAVQIIGAAGKKVVINNVLGQTLATTILSSDDAQITVPAGVVVVSVEGEAATKAIVK